MKKISILVLFIILPTVILSASRSSNRNSNTTTTETSARASTRTAPSNTSVVSEKSATTDNSARKTVSRAQTVAANSVASNSSSNYDSCKETFFSCMDQFCKGSEESIGRCECSNDIYTYEETLAKINELDKQAKDLATTEVERIQLGAKADYVFNNVKTYEDTKSTNNLSKVDLSIFDKTGLDFNNSSSDVFDSTNKASRGDNLFTTSQKLCLKKLSNCDDSLDMIKTLYIQNIQNDCNTYKKYLTNRQSASEEKLATAEKAQRAALLDSYNDSNKYNRGECMLEFKKCMADSNKGACGNSFENCTDKKVLESKKYICEGITDQCIAVRNYVWNDFLKEIEPTLKTAKILNENNLLYSCLGDITSCIKKSCTENLDGEENIDACLTNQEMARGFCKNQIDPCEKKVPDIWDYISAKLASMRVDSCTMAVKKCLTDENRCGSDYGNCVGLDTDDIKDLCPTDSLVACRKDNTSQSITDASVDEIIQGIFLNIDNQALLNCQKYADESMIKVCGDTANCNNLVVDENTGSGSLSIKKDGDDYVISGLIYWDEIKIDDNANLDIDTYKRKMRSSASSSKDPDKFNEILDKIVSELGLTQKLINSATNTIASDAKVSYCLNGRSVSGTRINSESGRFPNLLSQNNRIIAEQALRLVKNNYNEKLNSLLKEANTGVEADSAERLCANMAFDYLIGVPEVVNKNGNNTQIKSDNSKDTPLEQRIYNRLANIKISNDGVYENKIETTSFKETITAIFNRDSKICHIETRDQTCAKPRKKFCKKWNEVTTSTKDVQL